MSDAKSELEALIPAPHIHRISDREMRQAPLKIKQLLAVVKYVETHYKVFDKFRMLGKPKEEGGVSVSELLEGDVYLRLNELMRLLLPAHAAELTDDWCFEHLTNAHYWAFLKVALVQNKLNDVFTRAQGMIEQNWERAMRLTETEKLPSA